MATQTKQPRVRLSLDVSPELHTALKVAAARRRISMSELLRQLLENAFIALGASPALEEDLDSLAVRRELAAASVAALGDFWDNEVDAQWQNFQP
ncbi:MAG: ribbon-helix-helix protein, CopG family [Anaerolineae bacterium]